MNRWTRAPLADVAEIVSGATPKTSVESYWEGGIPWATPKDLSSLTGPYIGSTPRTITAAGLASCGANVLPAGSVLFSSRAPIGHVAINTVPMATNQGFKSMVPKDGHLDAKYLFHWLKANRSYLEGLGNGATFKEVSKAVVSRVEIPLPPLEEQRRIAAILDRADALRAKRREAIARLEELPQSIFTHMFGDTTEGNSRYESLPLAQWIDPARPITYGILKPGPDTDGGVPYVRVADMKDGGIDVSAVRRTTHAIDGAYRRSTLRAGDLLMSIRGHVGRLAEIPLALEGANITQDSARLAIAHGDAEFVRAALESQGLQRWMARRTKGAAVRGINLGDLRLAPIPKAPVNDQQWFGARMRAVRHLKGQARQQFTSSEALFASLQARAFTGRL